MNEISLQETAGLTLSTILRSTSECFRDNFGFQFPDQHIQKLSICPTIIHLLLESKYENDFTRRARDLHVMNDKIIELNWTLSVQM